jgi:hypothetical protein
MISLLKEKTVSIVGAASYLEGMGWGKEIDEFDLVIRINRGSTMINKQSSKDIGERSSILYHHLLEDPPGTNGSKFGFICPDEWLSAGIKNVIGLPKSDMSGVAYDNTLSELVNIDSVNRLSKKIPVSIVDYKFYNSISSAAMCKPNTGIAALFHAISLGPKKIKIFGYSFLLDGWFTDYHDGMIELPGEDRTMKEIENASFNSPRHIQENQWRLCKKLLSIDNVEFDPVLEKILRMDEFSKDMFSKIVVK